MTRIIGQNMHQIKKKLLLVDDEVDLCKVAAWDFEDAGFEVVKAHGGDEALSIIKEQSFDFLISDIKMPKGDGVELLKNIKEAQIELSGIFLMTGYADYPEKSLKDLGMTKMFQKPINIEEVINLLKTYI